MISLSRKKRLICVLAGSRSKDLVGPGTMRVGLARAISSAYFVAAARVLIRLISNLGFRVMYGPVPFRLRSGSRHGVVFRRPSLIFQFATGMGFWPFALVYITYCDVGFVALNGIEIGDSSSRLDLAFAAVSAWRGSFR